MKCPYPNCGGEVANITPFAYCEKCYQPVLRCSKCETTNQSLALFCRHCGIEIDNLVSSTIFSMTAKPQQREPVRIGLLHSNTLNPDKDSKSAEMRPYGGF